MSEKSNEACWYVVHTYSGYENKVKDTLEKSIKSSNMQDYIFDVCVPVDEVSEIRKGKRVKSTRKVFPGYVIVNMIKTNESWYVVRNTRGCTGFVGPESKPEPLTEAEVAKMGVETTVDLEVEYKVGDTVEITAGPMEGSVGTVDEIDIPARKVRVKITMFGRELPAELELHQVKLF